MSRTSIPRVPMPTSPRARVDVVRSRPTRRMRGILHAACALLLGLAPPGVAAPGGNEEIAEDLVGGFMADLGAAQDAVVTATELRFERMEALHGVLSVLGDPEELEDLIATVYETAFGTSYQGVAGFIASGTGAEISVSPPDGSGVPGLITETFPFDLTGSSVAQPDWLDGMALLEELGDLTLTTLVYVGTFGSGPEHVGLDIRLASANDAWRVLVPLAIPGRAVPAEIVAELLARALAGDTTGTFDPLADLDPLQMPTDPSAGLDAAFAKYTGGPSGCDWLALNACLLAVLGQYSATCAAIHADCEADVKELQEEWKSQSRAGLWGCVAAGGIGGALGGASVGALGGGIGAIPGAALGAVSGAIGGAVGWLFSTGFSADEFMQKITERRQKRDEDLCAAMKDAGEQAKDCFEAFCPELAEAAEALIDAAIEAAGC